MTTSAATSFDEANLRLLVHRFYACIRNDDVLGPVFMGVIGSDDAVWAPHLETMTSFWHTVMLRKMAYKGNPMAKHMAVEAIEPEHFVRWLELFETAAHEVYAEPAASQIVDRAHGIGHHLTRRLFGHAVADSLVPRVGR